MLLNHHNLYCAQKHNQADSRLALWSAAACMSASSCQLRRLERWTTLLWLIGAHKCRKNGFLFHHSLLSIAKFPKCYDKVCSMRSKDFSTSGLRWTIFEGARPNYSTQNWISSQRILLLLGPVQFYVPQLNVAAFKCKKKPRSLSKLLPQLSLWKTLHVRDFSMFPFSVLRKC